MIEIKKTNLAKNLSVFALSILNFLIVFYFDKVQFPIIFFFFNLVLIFLLFSSTQKNKTGFVKIFFDWLPFIILLYIFKETYFMVHFINPTDYDEIFIFIDKYILGFYPTFELQKFSNPFLTEIFQLSYFSYYFIILIVPFLLYQKNKFDDFNSFSFLILFGFYLSYIGYFIFPGVGPRFTLHDFNLLNSELPGLFFTEPIRNFLNFAEGISNIGQSSALEVQRDLFPSGHVQLTLVAIYGGFKFNLKIKFLILFIGSLLIISTIYLRYHYFVDLIAGVVFFFLTIWSGKKIIEKSKKY